MGWLVPFGTALAEPWVDPGTVETGAPVIGYAAPPVPTNACAAGCPLAFGLDPFSVMRSWTTPFGTEISLRSGRHRSTRTLWGDSFGNFGWEHTRRHVGHRKRANDGWETETQALADISATIRGGQRTASNFDVDVKICTRSFGGFDPRRVTVVIDDHAVGASHNGGVVGVKTAWVNYGASWLDKMIRVLPWIIL